MLRLLVSRIILGLLTLVAVSVLIFAGWIPAFHCCVLPALSRLGRIGERSSPVTVTLTCMGRRARSLGFAAGSPA